MKISFLLIFMTFVSLHAQADTYYSCIANDQVKLSYPTEDENYSYNDSHVNDPEHAYWGWWKTPKKAMSIALASCRKNSPVPKSCVIERCGTN